MTGAPPSSPPPLLQATSLERRFGAFRALRGVSLTVSGGECHLVVGPNGAGKSTLLRLLAGLARASAGQILLSGAPLARDPTARRGIGLLSHQTFLYDDLTAFENLLFTARLHGLPGPAAVAQVALAAVGLGARGDESLRRLSRGMVQRVAIARALLPEPALLLLDEPFSGLDPEASERVASLLRDQLAQGRGVVLVSHDVHEAWELATHVHILIRGEWRASGPVSGTFESFLARYREALRE